MSFESCKEMNLNMLRSATLEDAGRHAHLLLACFGNIC